MYGLHEQLCQARSSQWQERVSRARHTDRVASALRWRRRADSARRTADRAESRATRAAYDLAR